MFNCACVRMLHQCGICGKTLSRKEHLHRHMKNVNGEGNSEQSIAMASNSTITEDDIYTAEETGEETEEESRKNSHKSEEKDNNPWKLILNKCFQKMDPIRDASIDKTVQEDEITHEEATKHVYDAFS